MPDIAPTDPNAFTPNRFQGQILLITGAATGIGAATALRAAREGARIVAVDRKEAELRQTIARLSDEAMRRSPSRAPWWIPPCVITPWRKPCGCLAASTWPLTPQG